MLFVCLKEGRARKVCWYVIVLCVLDVVEIKSLKRLKSKFSEHKILAGRLTEIKCDFNSNIWQSFP